MPIYNSSNIIYFTELNSSDKKCLKWVTLRKYVLTARTFVLTPTLTSPGTVLQSNSSGKKSLGHYHSRHPSCTCATASKHRVIWPKLPRGPILIKGLCLLFRVHLILRVRVQAIQRGRQPTTHQHLSRTLPHR